mmetsp:Transcript_20275/g.22018  ORF Transcript_20275/g.22018 Transcript_20275/m.22018 type:complete len:401 (+) Transcript_20275:288-1490(+)|eukprot:CAMPEP_0173135558 /NCGR_PEP_ID=MMETSP1105-20130129/1964_1 /TAXON_ID=2985 /ORGANISM="Ochromonas sp., Strain BG-1" /LENGTH=400 /DNA_ID=CAMNT_0014047581 /DNA_START=196 /DNA_END=1398 /DNA_ORIENTATION=+
MKNGDDLPDDLSLLTFPQRLFLLLEKENRGIVDWVEHGACFRIIDHRKFVRIIIPKYFKQSKFTSFQRQLNIYGFKKLLRGDDKGSYFHPHFQRNRRELLFEMKRLPLKGSLATYEESVLGVKPAKSRRQMAALTEEKGSLMEKDEMIPSLEGGDALLADDLLLEDAIDIVDDDIRTIAEVLPALTPVIINEEKPLAPVPPPSTFSSMPPVIGRLGLASSTWGGANLKSQNPYPAGPNVVPVKLLYPTKNPMHTTMPLMNSSYFPQIYGGHYYPHYPSYSSLGRFSSSYPIPPLPLTAPPLNFSSTPFSTRATNVVSPVNLSSITKNDKAGAASNFTTEGLMRKAPRPEVPYPTRESKEFFDRSDEFFPLQDDSEDFLEILCSLPNFDDICEIPCPAEDI